MTYTSKHNWHIQQLRDGTYIATSSICYQLIGPAIDINSLMKKIKEFENGSR